MKKLLKNKKALSPVVAAIILIAVTVAVSIAVAAWMGALTFTFMATEQVAFTGCTYATGLDTADIKIKNSGTSILTIDQVLINNQLNSSSPGWAVQGTADRTLDPGEEITIRVNANAYGTSAGIVNNLFVQGSNYAFTVVTSKNNQFGPYTKTAPS
jgi:flagellin-like protein